MSVVKKDRNLDDIIFKGSLTKGPSINDFTPEGEGGGVPQKVTRGDKGEVPCFNQR